MKTISPHQNYQESVEIFCWINYIRNLEPNCQYSCTSCSSSSEIVAKSLPPPQNGFVGLSKHLHVFLLGTENRVKLKNCWIGTKIGVVVDIDPMIMIVVTKRQKDKKTKRQKDKKYKKDKKDNTKKD